MSLRTSIRRTPRSAALASAAVAAALLALPLWLGAQDRLSAMIDTDSSHFAISDGNRIVYSVPHLKHVKKIMTERDTIFTADFSGHEKAIVEPDKFMPVPPPQSYIVSSLSWSPDGRHIAATMLTIGPPSDNSSGDNNDDNEDNDDNVGRKLALPPSGKKVIALFDDDGREIRVAGSKDRFIENASNPAWLSDGQTVVYLTGAGPYKIVRVRPADGQSRTLFEGHSFDSVAWDTARDQAFAVGQNLSISGRTALVQLDLVHETVREIGRLPNFQGQLTVSADGKKVGFFSDPDTIEVRDVANPLTPPIHVRTGPGAFEFGPDDRRILIKRGLPDKSGDLVWVGLYDDTWKPILHDLEFHSFAIAKDGSAVIVVDPGRGNIKIYPLR